MARLVKKLHPGDATGISAGSAMMQSTLSLGVYHVYIYIYFLVPSTRHLLDLILLPMTSC